MGVLKSGEFILSPNDYSLHRKGNISDLISADYVTLSRYILAIDIYSSPKSTIQTYEYKTEVIGSQLVTHVDCYVSNDDGHLANKSNSSAFSNDFFVGGKYVFAETIPVILNGMFLKTFVLNTHPLIPTKLTANNLEITYNHGKYLTAVLNDENGNPIKNAKLFIALKGKTYTKLTDSKGQVKLFVGLAPNTYTAKVTFGGDNRYLKSSATAKIHVKKDAVKILKAKKTYKFKKSKKSKNISVTLKNSKNRVLKNIRVTIKLSGKKIRGKKTVTAKTSKKGVVTFKLGKKLTKKTRVKYTITYKGNAYYKKVTKKGTIRIV